MQKEKIIFIPLVTYFQKQNNLFKEMKRTIIDMTKAKILKYNINNDL